MANIIFGMANVAKTALITQQKALSITSHNIANVNTEGYSRQRVNMEQNEPVYHEGGALGTGVRANRTIQRIYDSFLNAQIVDASAKQGRWEAQKEGLQKAELMFDEANGYGLNNAMNEFFSTWQQVANNPSGYTERVTLIGKSEHLASTFNKLSADLSQVQQDSDNSIKGAVDQINRLTGEIAELNLKIAEIESGNIHSANDFKDQRDLKLKELSGLINIDSFEDNNGFLTVTTSNGRTLVDRVTNWNLTTGLNASGHNDVFWEAKNGSTQNITADIRDGKLRGWIETRDTIIPDYQSRLNDMAQTMITQVNALHSAGRTMAAPPNDTGIDFFTGTDASTIAVNPNLVNDSNLLAAALATEGVPGGNGNAIAISELANGLTMSGATATFNEFYSSLVSDVGRQVAEATFSSDHQVLVSQQLDTHREEVSGVNMDEEMVNMIQFQSAYKAAAKIVTTVDTMLESLIAMV